MVVSSVGRWGLRGPPVWTLVPRFTRIQAQFPGLFASMLCGPLHGTGNEQRRCGRHRHYGAGMSSDATITGIHHFSPTVSDVEASATWYEQVFSMFRAAGHLRPPRAGGDRLRRAADRSRVGPRDRSAPQHREPGRSLRRGPHRARPHRVQGPHPREPRRLGDQARRLGDRGTPASATSRSRPRSRRSSSAIPTTSSSSSSTRPDRRGHGALARSASGASASPSGSSAKRSPCSSTLARTSGASNTRSRPPAAASSTSSHVTGVLTVGRGRARREYTATVVLCRLFWLQSMKTLPARADFAIVDVTRFGWCFSSTWATAWANSEQCSWVCLVLSGTYTCRPFEPDVLAKHSQPGQVVEHLADVEGHLGALGDPGARAGIEVEHAHRGRLDVLASRHRRMDLERRHVGRPTPAPPTESRAQ